MREVHECIKLLNSNSESHIRRRSCPFETYPPFQSVPLSLHHLIVSSSTTWTICGRRCNQSKVKLSWKFLNFSIIHRQSVCFFGLLSEVFNFCVSPLFFCVISVLFKRSSGNSALSSYNWMWCWCLISELKGAVGQIIHNDRTVLAVEQNKTLMPQSYGKYLAWGFPDMSIRIGNYDSDKVRVKTEEKNISNI